jgi:hypothetical protein
MTLADKLRPYVETIKADAKNGNKNAQQIISLYRMHCSSPSDPGAPAFCECYFKDWLKERAEKDSIGSSS